MGKEMLMLQFPKEGNIKLPSGCGRGQRSCISKNAAA